MTIRSAATLKATEWAMPAPPKGASITSGRMAPISSMR